VDPLSQLVLILVALFILSRCLQAIGWLLGILFIYWLFAGILYAILALLSFIAQSIITIAIAILSICAAVIGGWVIIKVSRRVFGYSRAVLARKKTMGVSAIVPIVAGWLGVLCTVSAVVIGSGFSKQIVWTEAQQRIGPVPVQKTMLWVFHYTKYVTQPYTEYVTHTKTVPSFWAYLTTGFAAVCVIGIVAYFIECQIKKIPLRAALDKELWNLN
jgi:hypothetical protein